MSYDRVTIGALVALASIGAAFACGPFFPWQLLDNRDKTLSEPVELGFDFEASRLVHAPDDGLRAVERTNAPSDSADKLEQEAVIAERQEARTDAWRPLMGNATPESTLVSKLAAARAASDGEAAMSAGAGLPPAVLNYVAGAIEFRAGRFAASQRFFVAIDRLPSDQRKIRAVAAAYMTGRSYQHLGQMALARVAFQAARRHALAGAPDPMGLAVASLGEEARINLVEVGLVTVPWPVKASETDDATVTRLIADAVRLYAEQAARGSKMALLSLREVAGLLVSRDTELNLAVADPVVRRLLTGYVVARQAAYAENLSESEDRIVSRVSEAVLAQAAPADGPELDRLALLAYQSARYELAERLTSAADRPLGLWIRAKLELRRGDHAAAVRDWTAALRQVGSAGTASVLDDATKTRLRGEAAVIKLSQGEYHDALRLLFPVAQTYWGDVAYIAERVLTVDELKAFVDSLPRSREPRWSSSDSDWDFHIIPEERLRDLLARRLVRDGRTREALAYFPSPALESTPDRRDADRATAHEAAAYLAMLEAARPGWLFDWPWQKISRAEALFNVATMTRRRGLELMGTEGPPDEAVLGGSFPDGFGQSKPEGASDSPSPLVSSDEARRFSANAPRPNVRFHYRVIATDQALAAAHLLPQRSQAYAATLCWATRYAFDSSDEMRATTIYRRYVATGAYQRWARRFGRECPEPDFEAARTFWWRRILAWSTQTAASVWRHPIVLVALGFAAAALLIARASVRRGRQARSTLRK